MIRVQVGIYNLGNVSESEILEEFISLFSNATVDLATVEFIHSVNWVGTPCVAIKAMVEYDDE